MENSNFVKSKIYSEESDIYANFKIFLDNYDLNKKIKHNKKITNNFEIIFTESFLNF